MSNNTDAKAKVLFVDDDGAFLQLVDQAFASFSKGGWEILLATDAAKALKVLQEHTVNLAVLDINMPGVSGLDLLKVLNRDHPGLQKVFLTGLADQQTRISGLEGGAELFLEKPANLAGFESVFATLKELVRWQQKQGDRGNLRPARLLDIIKMECSSGNSRLFEVFGEDARGQIFIKEGMIVHAQCEGRRGQSAFAQLASQLSSEFNLKQFIEPPERSVDRQWEFLVMEAFRMQEQLLEAAAEAKAKAAAQPAAKPVGREPSDTGTSPPVVTAKTVEPSPPLRPSAPPLTRELAPQAAATPAVAPKPDPAAKTAPPPATPAKPALATASAEALAPKPETGQPTEQAEPDVIEPAVLNPMPPGLRLTTAGEPAAFRIEEMLLCSKQREILYEWQSDQTDSRVRLIEYIAQRFHHTNHGLPLGKFDRIEAQANDSRIVVHFQGDNGLLIRSNTPGRAKVESTPKSNQPATEWLKRAAAVSGALASGIVRPDLIPTSMAFSMNVPADRLNSLWVQIAEAFEVVNERRFSAWQLRLIYERAQCYCVQRSDRFVFGLLLVKEPEVLEIETAAQVIGQVDQFRGV